MNNLYWTTRESAYSHPVLGNFFRTLLKRNDHPTVSVELAPYNCRVICTPDQSWPVEKKTLVFDTDADELMFILKWSSNAS